MTYRNACTAKRIERENSFRRMSDRWRRRSMARRKRIAAELEAMKPKPGLRGPAKEWAEWLYGNAVSLARSATIMSESTTSAVALAQHYRRRR